MILEPIFAPPFRGLLAVVYPLYENGHANNVNEFVKVFRQWFDPEYLEKFFHDNLADLQSGFYGEITVEDAVLLTIQNAKVFENKFLDIARSHTNSPSNTTKTLGELFKPLLNDKLNDDLTKSKAKGDEPKSWLRIYAIRVNENFFIITGGTIKLTLYMDVRAHTNKELDKIRRVRDFLVEEGMYDEDAYQELFF